MLLEGYVQNSVQWRAIIDGEQETVDVRTVTTALSIVLLWKNLVGYANNTVLQEKQEQ